MQDKCTQGPHEVPRKKVHDFPGSFHDLKRKHYDICSVFTISEHSMAFHGGGNHVYNTARINLVGCPTH